MRRAIAAFFLFLYIYNVAGYLAVFYLLQSRARAEARARIATEVPDDQLTLLSFPLDLLKQESDRFQWTDDNEFCHKGEMYDVARTRTVGDSVHFLCFRDRDEERLLSGLQERTQRDLNDKGERDNFDSFKDVFKNSLNTPVTDTGMLAGLGPCVVADAAIHHLLVPTAPFYPPRHSEG